MHERLLTAAIEYDKGDPKRIQHFIKVHSFARLIGKQEKLSDEMMKALETANGSTAEMTARYSKSSVRLSQRKFLSRSADMRMSQSV